MGIIGFIKETSSAGMMRDKVVDMCWFGVFSKLKEVRLFNMENNMRKNWTKFAEYGAMAFLAVLVFRFMYILTVYADKYPHWDEWRFVPMQKPLLAHLFSFNNENMQVFTNAIYAMVEIFGLPFKAVTILGGLVYMVTLFVFYKEVSHYVPKERQFVLMFLMIPCLSDFMLDNLLWPILSQTSFYFLFIILAVKYGFRAEQSNRTRWLTLGMVLCSILSMNVSFAIVFTIIYLTKNFYNTQGAEERRKEIMFASVWLEVMAVAIALFWYGMRKADTTVINWSSLGHLDFYEQFSYALLTPMTGFWADHVHTVFWLLFLAVVFAVLLWQFILQIKEQQRQGIWALVILISSGMAAITLFRGELVYALTDHAVRYVFYGVFFIPVFYAAVSYSEVRGVKIGADVWAAVVLVLGLSYFMTHNRINAAIARITDGGECIKAYYEAPRRPHVWYCAGRYFHNLAPNLDHFEEVFLK